MRCGVRRGEVCGGSRWRAAACRGVWRRGEVFGGARRFWRGVCRRLVAWEGTHYVLRGPKTTTPDGNVLAPTATDQLSCRNVSDMSRVIKMYRIPLKDRICCVHNFVRI